MKKALLFLAILCLTITPAFAWHCVDSDEDKPQWGDNGYGEWGDDESLGGTTDGWRDEGDTLPEGCTMLGKYTGTCEDVCVDLTLREFSCEDREGFEGETVITWNDYENAQECLGEEAPEFGVLAGLAAVSLAGIFIYKRRK